MRIENVGHTKPTTTCSSSYNILYTNFVFQFVCLVLIRLFTLAIIDDIIRILFSASFNTNNYLFRYRRKYKLPMVCFFFKFMTLFNNIKLKILTVGYKKQHLLNKLLYTKFQYFYKITRLTIRFCCCNLIDLENQK